MVILQSAISFLIPLIRLEVKRVQNSLYLVQEQISFFRGLDGLFYSFDVIWLYPSVYQAYITYEATAQLKHEALKPAPRYKHEASFEP